MTRLNDGSYMPRNEYKPDPPLVNGGWLGLVIPVALVFGVIAIACAVHLIAGIVF